MSDNVSKLTLIAKLQDDLTKPLKGITKSMNDASKAADKSGISVDRQAKAFKELATQAGWSTDRLGKWHRAGGAFTSQSERAAMAANALSLATMRTAHAARDEAQALSMAVQAAGWKLHADGKVRNSLGHYVSAQNIAIARTMYASEQAKRNAAATANMGTAAQQSAVFTTLASQQMHTFSARAVRWGAGVQRLGQRMGMSAQSARGLGVAVGNALNSGAVSQGVAYFNNNLSKIATHAQKVSGQVESAMKKAGKAIALGAGAGAGAALYSGMTRINALEAADVRLEVQGFDEEKREEITGLVNEKVTGTFMSLNDGMGLAQKLLGAGVDYEKEFEDRMQTSVNASALYSAHDPELLPMVLGQIESKGVLTGEEMNQLAELNIPIRKWIAEEKGIEQSEVMNAIETRQVSSDDMWDAMRSNVEGGADKMGETFKGAWLVFKASVARAGEDFLMPLLGSLRRGLVELSKALDNLEPFWQALGKAADGGLSKLVDLFPEIGRALEPLGPSLIRLVEALSYAAPQLIEGFVNWLEVITPVLVPLMDILAVVLKMTAWAMPALIPLLFAVFHGFQAWFIIKKLPSPIKDLFKLLSKGDWLLKSLKWTVDIFAKSLVKMPFAWVVLAVIAVIAIFNKLYDEVDWVRDAFDTISDAIRNVVEWFDKMLAKADEWLGKDLGLDKVTQDVAKDWGLPDPKESHIFSDFWAGLSGGLPSDESLEDHGWDRKDFLPEGDRKIVDFFENLFGIGDNAERDKGWFHFGQGSEDRVNPLLDGESSWETQNRLLQEGGSATPGYADGGWIGAQTINVGERGREFMTSSWAANAVETTHPGAMEYINNTGTLPPTGGVSVQAHININGAQDPAMIQAMVEAAIRNAAREANREYMNLSARGAH